MERSHALGGLTIGLLGLIVAVSIAVAMTAEGSTTAQSARVTSADERADAPDARGGRLRVERRPKARRGSAATPLAAAAPQRAAAAGSAGASTSNHGTAAASVSRYQADADRRGVQDDGYDRSEGEYSDHDSDDYEGDDYEGDDYESDD